MLLLLYKNALETLKTKGYYGWPDITHDMTPFTAETNSVREILFVKFPMLVDTLL